MDLSPNQLVNEQFESKQLLSMGEHTESANTEPPQTLTNADCCCDVSAFIDAKAPEVVKVPILIVARMGLSNDPLRIQGESTDSQHFSIRKTSLPVYLATQHLRL